MTQTTLDPEALSKWIGRTETATDQIDPGVVRRAQAFFDLRADAAPGEALPALWHWFFFHQPVAQGGLGRDGHHKLGGMLPPIALPRRMWGGSRLTFHRTVLIGQEARKTSTVKSVALKQGRSGPLGQVTIEHVISQEGSTCLSELQELVYMQPMTGGPDAASVADAPPTPEGSAFRRRVAPDEVMLFRYSALTYNAHRIHYDLTYARDIEGYPGIVVHGPLTASLLALFATQVNDARPMTGFSFRGTSPLFAGQPFTMHARPERRSTMLWVERSHGGMGMKAQAEFAD